MFLAKSNAHVLLGGVEVREEVKLPAMVMGHEQHHMRLFLPLDVITQNQEQEETLLRILLTLERAIRQRKIQYIPAC